MKISVLEGQAHVRPHFGITNAKLRVNLPLVVPQDAPSMIRVGDDIKQLEEGKMIVFDDSFEHEVWNGSDEVRIVLLLDINHPELSREQVVLYENKIQEVILDFDGPTYEQRQGESLGRTEL